DDLIRSKETEREDDWRDVRLLEEIADERRLARTSSEDLVDTLANLRSQRGFERARAMGVFDDAARVVRAISIAEQPIAASFLAPFAPDAARSSVLASPPAIASLVDGPLRRVEVGSARHLALVEAVRRLYRQAAMARDRQDKQRALAGG